MFATFVQNKYVHSPHFKDTLKSLRFDVKSVKKFMENLYPGPSLFRPFSVVETGKCELNRKYLILAKTSYF